MGFGELDTDEHNVKDAYDALETATKIHNKDSGIGRDIVVSQTDLALENWGRNIFLLARAVEHNINQHALKARTQREIEIIAKIATTAKKDLDAEFDLLHAYTRSRKGASFKALTKVKDDQKELEEMGKNFLQKFTSAPPEKAEEE